MGHKNSTSANRLTVEQDYTTVPFDEIQHICRQTNLIDKEVYLQHDEFLKIAADGRLTIEQYFWTLQIIGSVARVQEFYDRLFKIFDRERKGFLTFAEFFILKHQLQDDKSFLGLVFDMFDTRQNGFLPKRKVQPLFKFLCQLVEHRGEQEKKVTLSEQHLNYLLQIVNKSKTKCLLREQFANILNTEWIDEENGVGVLHAEHTC